MDDGSHADHHNNLHRRTTQTLTRAHALTTTDCNTTTTANLVNHSYMEENEGAGDESFDGGSSRMWTTFTDSFQQVQSVLDRNRVLIQQVNDNHRSKIHDNLVKNVSLIQEINGNINKVVSLYSALSVNFSNMCQQQISGKEEAGKSDS
ncbi:protein EARLY FLOWERING 4-like [Coffea eugenioides]|uniref:protein EARLY FLOWERING 4-like n=1 Tax=Coffea eugenioides TaxID=49369 RepID=UPI000F60ADC1|nr:protein EARLY FLOWERING 4-like [Coffea eugenioides]